MDTPYNTTILTAGSEPVHTTEATIASGQNLTKLTPLGQVTATGKFVAWDPAASDGSQKAVYLLAHDVDASTGDVVTQVYKSGNFNVDLIQFGAATVAQQLACFVGTPISLQSLA